MKPILSVLADLKACHSGIDEVRAAGTFRAAWDSTTSTPNMAWLIARALPRQRLVRVAVRCAETCAHLAPPECLPLLADVSAWADGDDTIDLLATREALWRIRTAAAAYAAAANAAAAAAAAAAAFAAADAYAAICDVIRDEVDADEIAAALCVDPDAVF